MQIAELHWLSAEALQKVWRGQEKLYVAFWGYYIRGQLMLVFAAMLFVLLFDVALGFEYVGSLIGLSILFAWIVWSSIGVWRCAFNVKYRIWAHLGRLCVVLQLYLNGHSLVVYFARNVA